MEEEDDEDVIGKEGIYCNASLWMMNSDEMVKERRKGNLVRM